MNNSVFDKMMCKYLIFFSLLVFSCLVFAEEPIEMRGTNIKGATELPKVLYIVPWKKAELGDILMQAGVSMFDDELAPIDRDVFRRQVQYYELLSKQDQPGAAKK
jgi:hypothetical protein